MCVCVLFSTCLAASTVGVKNDCTLQYIHTFLNIHAHRFWEYSNSCISIFFFLAFLFHVIECQTWHTNSSTCCLIYKGVALHAYSNWMIAVDNTDSFNDFEKEFKSYEYKTSAFFFAMLNRTDYYAMICKNCISISLHIPFLYYSVSVCFRPQWKLWANWG